MLVAVIALPACGLRGGEVPSTAEPVGPWRRDGAVVDRAVVQSFAGAAHCDWQNVHFLGVDAAVLPGGSSRKVSAFIRDPRGALGVPELMRRFDASSALPTDAVATGYENGGYALWLAPSERDAAFLVRDDHVERWPRTDREFGCA